MISDDLRWFQMVSDGFRWFQMVSFEPKGASLPLPPGVLCPRLHPMERPGRVVGNVQISACLSCWPGTWQQLAIAYTTILTYKLTAEHVVPQIDESEQSECFWLLHLERLCKERCHRRPHCDLCRKQDLQNQPIYWTCLPCDHDLCDLVLTKFVQ